MAITAAAEAQLTEQFITPARIVSTSGDVSEAEVLLEPFSGQLSVADRHAARMRSSATAPARVVLDMGREMHGGIEIAAPIRASHTPARLRVQFGESVSEAIYNPASDGNAKNFNNDHAVHATTVDVPWLGTVRVGNTGFRFVCIELEDIDTEMPIRAVRGVARERQLEWLGAFKSDNERLNRIWQAGARTVALCMQDYVWDGIKRDRLVWIGDINPEVMTINNVFGNSDVVRRSLDFARDDTPLPGWMNGMCSYSLWWIITHRDLFLHQADTTYLTEQHDYLRRLINQIDTCIDRRGREHLSGTRFIDWPTSRRDDVIQSGLQSMCVMAVEAAQELALALDDLGLSNQCNTILSRLRRAKTDHCDNNQAAALKILAGNGTEADTRVLTGHGPEAFSTFYGYYMLEALAKTGHHDKAVEMISRYWGGMLDLGADTFWEEFDYSAASRAGRIDQPVPAGTFDIHADGGDYCFKGLRLSMCHGWASGPTSWLTRHVLGVRPTRAGFRSVLIEPHLVGCTRVEGAVPTPFGVITVSHRLAADGKIHTTYSAPEAVQVHVRGAIVQK